MGLVTANIQDPHWGWYIVWYFFLGGIAGGAYFLAAIADFFGGPRERQMAKVGYYLALPLVVICGILLILDLGTPSRFLNMLREFKWRSPMSVGAWGLAVFGVFSAVSAILAYYERGPMPALSLPEASRSQLRRVIGLVGTIFGFFLASYTGVLLASTAVPMWTHGRLLGALFLASGASTGVAAIAVIAWLRGMELGPVWGKIHRFDMFAIVWEAILLIALLVSLGAAASPIVSGRYAALFWVGLVAIGLVIPFVLQLRARGAHHGRVSFGMALPALLVLIGGLVLRYVVIMGGPYHGV